MISRLCPALGLGLLLGGCAGPLDDSWGGVTSERLHSLYAVDDQRLIDEPEDGSLWASRGIESLEKISVNDAIRFAILQSPRLRRAGYLVDAATGRMTQAGLYPNPSFAFEAEALGSDAGGGGETVYRVEQEIVLGGRIRWASEVAESDLLSAQSEFVAEEFAVASRVTRSYFAASAAEERHARRRDLADLADQLLEAATAKVDAGAATEPDRLRAEVVREQALIELEAARLDAVSARRRLASVMGLDVELDLILDSPADELPRVPMHDKLVSDVLRVNSRMTLARIAVERARRAHRLAKAQAVPSLFASIGPRYSDIDNETTLDLGIGMEIPLFDRNQGGIRSAHADRLAAAAELRGLRLDLLAEVSAVRSAYESALSAVTRFKDQLLPKADRTLELTRQAYLSGKADYLRLLDAQQVVVEARIAYVDSLQRLHEAAAILRELAQTDAPWREPRPDDSASEEGTP